MTDELRDLFLSDDMEDINLAFAIARKLDIPVKEVDVLFTTMYERIGADILVPLWKKYFDKFMTPTIWRKEE